MGGVEPLTPLRTPLHALHLLGFGLDLRNSLDRREAKHDRMIMGSTRTLVTLLRPG